MHISKHIYTHTYLKLNHFAVYLKLALHCQLTVLQLKTMVKEIKRRSSLVVQVVRTWCSHGCGLGSICGPGTKIPQLCGATKKKKIKNRNTDYKM